MALFRGMVQNMAEQSGAPPTMYRPTPVGPAQPVAPAAPTAPASSPWLRDAIAYSGINSPQPGNHDPRNLWADMQEIDSTHADWNKGVNERTYNVDNGEGTTVRNVRYLPKEGSFLARLAATHPEALSQAIQTENGQDGGRGNMAHSMDFSKLPRTRFGSADQVMAVTDQMMDKLKDRNMVYDDPNYGRITHWQNYNSGNDWVKNIPMMLAGAGFGALPLMPAMALPGIRLAQGFGQGGSPWGQLASLVGGAMGLPSWAKPLTGMAISQLTKNNKPSGG